MAFRFFYALPHHFWLGVLSYAAYVVLFLGWFVALFTGRIPEGMSRFLAQWIRYNARVYGYAEFLLTDEYPPFALDRNDYGITLEVNPGKLSRLAVFFRLILVIPAAFLAWLLTLGSFIVSIVGWLMTLVTGQLPTALHQAFAAVLNYQTRTVAYFAMLTAEYPNRMFGEEPEPPLPLWDPDAEDAANAGASADSPYQPTGAVARHVRRLVGLFLALGLVFGIGGFVAMVALADFSTGYDELYDSRNALVVDLNEFDSDAQSCALSGGPECLQRANSDLADAFDRFADEVERIDFSLDDPGPLINDARRVPRTCFARGASP